MKRPQLPPVLVSAVSASLLSTALGLNPVLPAAKAKGRDVPDQ